MQYMLYGSDSRMVMLYLTNVNTADEMFIPTMLQVNLCTFLCEYIYIYMCVHVWLCEYFVVVSKFLCVMIMFVLDSS